MNTEYNDIRSRIPEPPKWWDEFAVPRYCDFHPSSAANIYARAAVLILIECQACGRKFRVCMSAGRLLANAVRDGSLHYGDPPNVRCCEAGPSMNCIDVRVIEYWHRQRLEWSRDASLEMELGARN
jgi:hypothetical protein